MIQNRLVVRAAQVILFQKRREFSTEVEITTSPYKVFKLKSEPPTTSKITKDEALKVYEHLCSIRRMENALAQLYTQQLVRGFCHLYDGQEAVCCGIHSTMGPKDTIITSYRAHGWNLVMGNTLHGMIAELLGKSTGVSKGKGGSMHTFGKNFYGGNGIVGAHVPIGTGLALQHKYNSTGGISVICFGDGAANQGQVFESFNMAKLWSLPAFYVVENNLYGMGTSSIRSSANSEYYTRGDYIPGVQADGMDYFSVREASKFCKEYILCGHGPIIMEAITYRYHGHSMSDPGTSYRTREEVKNVREKSDPLNMFKKKIVDSKLCTEEEMNTVDNKVKKDVKEVVEASKKDTTVPIAELAYDVYSLNLGGDYIPGIQADCMDFFSVRDAASFCKKYILDGNGPIIMEVITYWYHGHSMSDPGTSYRTREEVKNVREKSGPLNMFKKKVADSKLCTEEELNAVDDKVKKDVKQVVETSQKDTTIPVAELTYDVYALNLGGKIRSCQWDKPMEHKVTGLAVNLK